MSRVVVITGAAGGLGSALVRRYKMMGDYVVALTHEEHDVRRKQDAINIAKWVIELHGVPDIVIACAGTNAPVKRGDYEALAKVNETNYLGVIYTMWPYVNGMLARKSGHLVAISSVVGSHGLPGIEAYCASKAAVNMHCEGLRRELAPAGVAVTTIAPGYVDTPSTRPHLIKRPWMLSADEFARRAVAKIDAGVPHATIPWQMGIASTGLSLLPKRLTDRLLSGR